MRTAALVVLLASATPAVAEVTVTVSPETPVASRIGVPGNAENTVLANGPQGRTLAVWRNPGTVRPDAIIATRIDANAMPEDPAGIYIAASDGAGRPGVAFDGTSYLVVWSNDYLMPKGVLAARLATDGTLIDATPISLGDAHYDVTVAASPGQFLVVWTSADYNSILARRVAGDGTILDAAPLTVGSGSFVRGVPSVIFDGTSYVVVWGSSGLYAARVSTSGSVVAPGAVQLTTTAGSNSDPAIAFDGTNYLVAWNDGSLKQMRISSSFTPLETPKSFYGGGASPVVAFDGTNYLVAIEADGGTELDWLQLVQVSTTNTLVKDTRYELGGEAGFGEASGVFNGSQFMLAFKVNGIGSGLRVDTTDTAVDATPIVWSLRPNDQRAPAIAFNGTDHVVAWADSHDSSIAMNRLVGMSPSAGTGTVVRSHIAATALACVAPGAADSPTIIAWRENFPSAIRIARVAPNGDLLDPDGIVIRTDVEVDQTSTIAGACTKHVCLLAWQGDSFQIAGLRVDVSTGVVLDSAPLDLGSGISPRVAASDDSFLVAVSSGESFVVPERASPLPAQLPPRDGLRSWDVRWEGDHYVYAWTKVTDTALELDVARLDRSGRLVGSAQPVAQLTSSAFVNVASDGRESIVTWTPWFETFPPSATTRLYAARFSYEGELLDPGGVEIELGAVPVDVASGSDGTFVVVEQLTGETESVAARWISITGDNPDGPSSGGGCCDCRQRRPPVALVTLVALVLRRRRRRRAR